MVWSTPGVAAAVEITESELLWGADHARNGTLWQSGVLSSTMRDDANSPTTVLRSGLLLGRLDSGNEYEEWDADVLTGTQNFAGVLDCEMNVNDRFGTAEDKVFRILRARAPVKARKLLIQGAAFVGHADEYLARRQMVAAGFVFDDDPQGYKAGLGSRVFYETAATDTLTADQNGATLFYMNAASVTVTLPAIKPGLEYTLIRSADEEFIVVSPTADNVIVGNDLSADGVTFTTAGEQIGATVKVKSVYYNGTLKWLMELPWVPFGTGLNTMTYAVNS